MNESDIKKASKGTLKSEIATRSNDPNFYAGLSFLPNPDEVLRKMGKSQEVYDAIIMDSHVLGDLRSVRSALLGFEYQLNAGGESAADIHALELCQKILDTRPAPGMQWSDVIWNMAQGVFRGYRVHEVVWKREGQFLVPGKVVDRPNRRFVFSPDNELRLLTQSNPAEGEELGDKKWLLTRHMHSYENPYGVAIFSACFWPYIFKHNGFKYFMKFCEKYGIPWAIGKYPQGTPLSDQNELADQLADMVEDGVAAIPDTGAVDLLETKHSGEVVHERLINVCNRELSKALTSQTLATEIQGQGSRAASEVHRGREQSVNQSDRQIICDTFNQLFEWVTQFNFTGAMPPTFEFYEESEARKDWAEVIDTAREFVDIPATFAHDRLQIPMPHDGEAVLPRGNASAKPKPTNSDFSQCPNCGGHHQFSAPADDKTTQFAEQAAVQADELIADLSQPIKDLLKRANTLEEFRDGLETIAPDMDETKLGEMTALALLSGQLDGMHEIEQND